MRNEYLGVFAALLAVTLLAPAASANHADGLSFVMSGQDHPDEDGVLVQVLNDHPDDELVDQVSPAAECLTWVADVAAEVDLSYDELNVAYDIQIVGEEAAELQEVTFKVGTYDDGFSEAASETVEPDLLGTVTGELTAEDYTINEDDYAATQLCVSAVNPGAMAVLTGGGDSQTTYTEEENYPTPELGSMFLSGVGMLALVGMARFRHDG